VVIIKKSGAIKLFINNKFLGSGVIARPEMNLKIIFGVEKILVDLS
jgi:hypothetical protein